MPTTLRNASRKKKRKDVIRRDCPDFDFNKRRIILCHYCKKRISFAEVTLDHVIPISKGGTHDTSNLVVACKRCNGKKGDSDLSLKHVS